VPLPATFALFIRNSWKGRAGLLAWFSLATIAVDPKETRVARPVESRPITDDEGNRLLRIVRRSSGSVVTWRRAQMVVLAA
jgi:hypothetical protein